MTDSPPLFEEMLAAYPADKREFARRVYDRFANGDASMSFLHNCFCRSTYANYAKRIPQAVSETNQEHARVVRKKSGKKSAYWRKPGNPQRELDQYLQRKHQDRHLHDHPGKNAKRRRNGWPN